MKTTVVIPTYWTSLNPAIQRRTPEAVYDHPTPVESQSTLPRLLNSLKSTNMPTKSAVVIVVSAVTHQALEEKAEEKTREILSKYQDDFDIRLFSASTLGKIKSRDANLAKILGFYGYSNIRNLGLAVAQALGSSIVIFLDDDVIVNDQAYFRKAKEHVGKSIDGRIIGGVAGYYTNKDGSYYQNINRREWWKAWWPKERKMNEALKVIENKERLTETTFAFGGSMIVHWRMFQEVPFDPYISRGEDMDLLVNAKMFGFKFMLDTSLSVLHLPVKAKNPWSEMRQDLHRFLYMRQKLLNPKGIRNIKHISVQSLEPYPGYFLHSATTFKFAISSCLNSMHCLFQGNLEGFKEFSHNPLQISSALHFATQHRLSYFEFQRKWSTFAPKIRADPALTDFLERL